MMFLKTADLVDEHDGRLSFCHLPLRKFGRARGFHGSIATIKTFEDNTLLRTYLEEPGNHRVLVVDGGGSTRCAVVGDMIAGLAKDNGWAGLVINGAIRDVAEIDAMDFAIFALGHSPKKSSKNGIGSRDITVHFGNAAFAAGHYLYADADGVLVSHGPVHQGSTRTE